MKTIIIKNKHTLKPTERCCIKCGAGVTPGMCYTGKVLRGFSKLKRDVIAQHDDGSAEHVKTIVIEMIDYDKGYLCDNCASEYRCVTHRLRNGESEQVPIVITDRLHTLEVRDQIEGPRNYKGFNTRITR